MFSLYFDLAVLKGWKINSKVIEVTILLTDVTLST